jgi:hypothetical protein
MNEKMIPILDECFTFKIGDAVTLKIFEGVMEKKYPRMIVTERLLQQCPGGVQKHYKVQGTGFPKHVQRPEFEWGVPIRMGTESIGVAECQYLEEMLMPWVDLRANEEEGE